MKKASLLVTMLAFWTCISAQAIDREILPYGNKRWLTYSHIIDENIACDLRISSDNEYYISVFREFSPDLFFNTFISFGNCQRNDSVTKLIDEKFGNVGEVNDYDSLLTLSNTFPFLNGTTFKKNGICHDDFEPPAVCNIPDSFSSFSVILPYPDRVLTTEELSVCGTYRYYGYVLALKSTGQFQMCIDGLDISYGTWGMRDNTLVLLDAVFDKFYYLELSNGKLEGCHIPCNYCDTIVFRKQKKWILYSSTLHGEDASGSMENINRSICLKFSSDNEYYLSVFTEYTDDIFGDILISFGNCQRNDSVTKLIDEKFGNVGEINDYDSLLTLSNTFPFLNGTTFKKNGICYDDFESPAVCNIPDSLSSFSVILPYPDRVLTTEELSVCGTYRYYGYVLALKSTGQFQMCIDGLDISYGTWGMRDNTLVLLDAVFDKFYYLELSNGKLEGCHIPCNYCDTIVFKMVF